MAVSSKYFNFNKQRLSGLKGKPFGQTTQVYNEFTLYANCSLDSTLYTGYTDGDDTTLEIGVSLFVDTELVTPAIVGFYYYNDLLESPAAYELSEGAINAIIPCSNNWETLDSCGGSMPQTLYTRYADDALLVGVAIYVEPGLNEAFAGSRFSHNGYRYQVLGGVITSIAPCLTGFSSIENCFSGTYTTLYAETPESLEIGDRVYTDPNGDTENTASFSYNAYFYSYTAGVGITSIDSCST